MEDDFKRCSKCKTISLKSNFHKRLKSSDGFHPQCKFCGKNYYNKNLLKIRKYYLENRDEIASQQNEYKNNKYKTENNFRLLCKTRNRIYQALKGKVKSSSTKTILGLDIETYKNGWNFNLHQR